MSPKDLVARLTCKECGGGRFIPGKDYCIPPYHDDKPCPHCTNLNDEKDIMEIVGYLNYFYGAVKSTLILTDPDHVAKVLAQAYVNLAEFCALRGIELRKEKHALRPKIYLLINHITAYEGYLEIVDVWAWAAFEVFHMIASQFNLDLAKAVEEVMKERGR